MAFDVRIGTILTVILIVTSIPFVIDLMSWTGVTKEVIGFSDLMICGGIGVLVDWLIEKYTDWYDRWGGGGM